MLPRITVAICVSMAGAWGKRRLLSGGTGFLAISGIVLLVLIILARLVNLVYNCNSCMWESVRGFLTGVGFLFFTIFMVDLGHGVVRYCLGSSLLRTDSGRVLMVPL